MQSKIKFEYTEDGKLQAVETSPVFQGSVATTEFYLTFPNMGEDIALPSDTALICLTRSDNQVSGPLLMAPLEGQNGWKYISNGWLEDVDIPEGQDSATFKVGFLLRRYSQTGSRTLIWTKTIEQVELTIFPSSQYVPQNIDLDLNDELFIKFAEMEKEISKLTDLSVGTVTASSKDPGDQDNPTNPDVTAEIVTDAESGKYKLNMDFVIPRGFQGTSIIGAKLTEITE